MSEDHSQNNQAAEEGPPAQVVTFAELMSLFLCFFVLLLSFSAMDRQKYREVAGSLANAFGVQRKERAFESPKGTRIIASAFDTERLATRDKEERGKGGIAREAQEPIAVGRISAVGFGKYCPLTPDDTKEGREKNRRVEIIMKDVAPPE